MKAMVLRRSGARLQLEDRPRPQAGRDQLLLRVRACAVCRTDLHVIDGELSVSIRPRAPAPRGAPTPWPVLPRWRR
jgi:alcohol dehydrogenase, propanol-preferring